MEDRTLDAWSLDMVVTTVSVLRDEEECKGWIEDCRAGAAGERPGGAGDRGVSTGICSELYGLGVWHFDPG
jgi:hypothetical protein